MNQMSAPAPTRGLIVVVVAVVVGALILAIGFDEIGTGAIDSGSSDTDEQTTDTTVPPVTASTAPAGGQAPAEVPVYVANGAGVGGLAGTTTDQLRAAGYTAALEPGDSPAAELTQVYFLPEFEAEAQAVATALNLAADTVVAWPAAPPFEVPPEATVIVQLGSNFVPAG